MGASRQHAIQNRQSNSAEEKLVHERGVDAVLLTELTNATGLHLWQPLQSFRVEWSTGGGSDGMERYQELDAHPCVGYRVRQ